jgi:transcriptional repressor NrdR
VEGLFPTREPRELKTGEIGAHLMDRLREVDQVAFVRFASVYRRFEDAGDFVEEVETLLSDARDPARRIR